MFFGYLCIKLCCISFGSFKLELCKSPCRFNPLLSCFLLNLGYVLCSSEFLLCNQLELGSLLCRASSRFRSSDMPEALELCSLRFPLGIGMASLEIPNDFGTGGPPDEGPGPGTKFCCDEFSPYGKVEFGVWML